MEEFLRAWASEEGSVTDGEDVIMGDQDQDLSEVQLTSLRKCMEDFKPRIENNPWLQSVLASL
jgi:DNA mismatch repair protein MSH2